MSVRNPHLPTRRGADDAAQQSKLIPVIKGLRAEKILVSVETYSPAVTRASLEAGANVLNLTGTDASDEIFKLVAAHDAAVIICYVAGENVREVGDFDLSADPIPMLRDSLRARSKPPDATVCKKSSSIPAWAFTTATCRTAPSVCGTR